MAPAGNSGMRIAIVPARGGSKRIPDKNIVDFCGRPLLAYALEAARDAGLFDTIHVSTDSDRIAEVAAGLGHPVEFRRDPALADDHTPLLPVLRWVLQQYAARGREFAEICLVMPTAPLIEAADFRAAHSLYAAHRGERSVLAVAKLPVPVEWALRLAADGTLAPCRKGMDQVRSQDLAPAWYDSGTFIFLARRDIEAGRIDMARALGFPLARHKAIDIDEPEDLALARMLYLGARAAG